MRYLLGISALVLGAALLGGTAGADWIWELGDALGLVALAGMLYLSLPLRGQRRLQNHELVAYVVVALVALHALWFLVLDGAVFAYLVAGAPAYMWNGIAATLALAMMLIVSVLPTRANLHRNHRQFAIVHRWLAALAVVGAVYHTVASGLYFGQALQVAALVMLATGILAGRMFGVSVRIEHPPSVLAFTASALLAVGLLASARGAL